MIRRGTSAIICALLLSCSSSPPPSGGPEAPAPDAAPGALLTPVRIPAAAAAPAPPWFEPAVDGAHTPDPLGLHQVKTIAVGETSALVASSVGVFAVDAARGVVGLVVRPPGAGWLGIGGTGDAVFAADGAGTLYRAGGVDAAVAGGFVEVARLPGAVFWDAAPGLVAGATPARVHYSTANGARLQPAPQFRPAAIEGLAVRADGVIAVDAGAKVWVARAGKAWKPADNELQPRRAGPWIVNGDGNCTDVLTADGFSWLVLDVGHHFKKFRAWERDVDVGGADFPFAPPRPPLDARNPPPPRPIPRGGQRTHCDRLNNWQGIDWLEPNPVPIGRPPTRAADWIRNEILPRPGHSAADLLPLGDGRCGTAGDQCDDQAPRQRLPHVLRRDRGGAISVLPVPAACARPIGVEAIGSLALLHCGSGSSTAIFTLADAGFGPETTVDAASFADRGLAADGTIALVSDRPTLRAFVRRPVAAGDAGAWRTVAVPGAVAFRLLTGGRILVIVEEPTAPRGNRLGFVVGQPAGELVPLAAGVEVKGFVEGVDIDGDGRIILAIRGSYGTTQHFVASDGRLGDVK